MSNGRLTEDATFTVRVALKPGAGVVSFDGFEDGEPSRSITETQVIVFIGVDSGTGGTFKLSFDYSDPTVAISWQADPPDPTAWKEAIAAAIQAALNKLPEIELKPNGGGSATAWVTVTVCDDYAWADATAFKVVFNGALAGRNVAEIRVVENELTSTDVIAEKDVTLTAEATKDNTKKDDLVAQLQEQLNNALASQLNVVLKTPLSIGSNPSGTGFITLLPTIVPGALFPTITFQINLAEATRKITGQVMNLNLFFARGGWLDLTFGSTTAELGASAYEDDVISAFEKLGLSVECTRTEEENTTRLEIKFDDGIDLSAVQVAASHLEGSIFATLRAVDVTTTVASALNKAIHDAMKDFGIDHVAIDVSDAGAPLVAVHVTGDQDVAASGSLLRGGVSISQRAPVQVFVSGDRVGISVSDFSYAVDPLLSITRSAYQDIALEFQNSSYQELGLLTSPLRYDGKISDKISLTVYINSVEWKIELAPRDVQPQPR